MTIVSTDQSSFEGAAKISLPLASAGIAGKSSVLPRVAYLVNQYPAVSHSFIRREIHALERLGFPVTRFAIRGWDAPVVDPLDEAERKATRYVLRDGVVALLLAAVRMAARRPRQFWAAARLAARMSVRADRPAPYHGIYLLQACRLAEWMDAAGIDHLHAHFGTNPAEVAMLASVLSGKPWSFTVHGPDEFDRGVYLHFDEKIASARFTVAVNSFTRSQLMRHARPADWDKIKVVHCGLASDFLGGATSPVGEQKQLVCVGRLCGQKAQLFLLEAFAKLDNAVDWKLVLAGDGDLRPQIEQRIAELGLGARVSITGWIAEAEVRRLLSQSRALVLPSFAESLPVVIMEAMAMCRPVVSTYVAGIPELVVPGKTGWLVPAGDIEALAAALQACIAASDGDMAALGGAGATRVRQRHDVDHEAARLGAMITAHEVVQVAPAWSF